MKVIEVLDEHNYERTKRILEKYTVRAIIIRDGQMAMQLSSNGEYKIPGGGVEDGETYQEALIREVLEEIGREIIPESIKEIGEITEIRRDIFDDRVKYICHSLFYFCDINDKCHKLSLTDSEVRKGFTAVWEKPEIIYKKNMEMFNEPSKYRDTKFIGKLIAGEVN